MPGIAEFSRWTSRARYFTLMAAGLGLLTIYSWYRPALAQDRDLGGRDSGKSASLSKDQAERKLAADLAENTPEKKKKKETPAAVTNPGNPIDIIRDIRWLSPHMWAVYAILAVPLVAFTFAAERALALRKSRVLPYDFAAGLKAIASRKGDFDLQHAQRLCRQYPSSAATIVRAMCAKAGRPVNEVESAMTDASEREASRLYSNVRWQTLAFNVAPMLGLAGTVHGMLIAFYTTAHMPLGKNKMESLADGIYEALICTLAGLIVAIPTGILAHYFEGRILKLFQQIEDLTRSLIPQFERLEGRVQLAPLNHMSGPPAPILRHSETLEDDEEPMPIIVPKK